MQVTMNSWFITKWQVIRVIFLSGAIFTMGACSSPDRPFGLFSQTSRFDDITVVTTWTSGLKVTDVRMTRIGGISTAQLSVTDHDAKDERRYTARATWYDEHDGIVQPDLIFVQNGMLSPFNTATTVWKGPNPQARRVMIEFKLGE
jgi:hypothetical protein